MLITVFWQSKIFLLDVFGLCFFIVLNLLDVITKIKYVFCTAEKDNLECKCEHYFKLQYNNAL